MHTGYRWFMLAVLAIGVVVEILGVHRPGAGDTFTELYRSVMHTAWGAIVSGIMAWALLYHFPFGKDKPMGWLDVATVASGVALWYVGRRVG